MDTLNTYFFHQLKEKGPKSVLNWCMDVGLIVRDRKCPNCGALMRLVAQKKGSDGFGWICRKKGRENPHRVTVSIRKDSWFEGSNLTIINILLIAYFWYYKAPNDLIIHDLNVAKATVVDWNGFCRAVCMDICVKESCTIGGKNETVELDEYQFGRGKNKDKNKNGSWVVGGIELKSHRTFFKVVENRGKDQLLSIIKTYILPGTTIISECWKTYDCLDEEQFKRHAEEHSQKFKLPELAAHTSIQGTWAALKKQLNRKHCEGHFDSYLAEYMWRRSHPKTYFPCFLDAIKKVYPTEQC